MCSFAVGAGMGVSLVRGCMSVLSDVSRLTLYDPLECSPPGSFVHGISQARIQSGLPFPSPRDLPNPEIKPRFLRLPHCQAFSNASVKHLNPPSLFQPITCGSFLDFAPSTLSLGVGSASLPPLLD